MQKDMELEQKYLINIELTQGKELANQLKKQFESAKTSGETCEYLVEKILSSYEKALSMLKCSSALKLGDHLPVTSMVESPQSLSSDSSPRSEVSHRSHKNVFKKRKALQQWSEQVQVNSMGTGGEGPISDGFSWRKYGQKDILGASFPRAYYRCTHRHAQGCLATKQVQKSNEDPSLLEVTYKGRHTCNQASNLSTGLISFAKEGKKQKKESCQPKQEDEIQKQTEEKILNFGTILETSELTRNVEMERIPSFSFPSTPIEAENVDSHFFPEVFITPETSESNYFSCHIDNFGIAKNMQSSESELSELLSAPNSVTNSPIGDFDISLDQVDFDPNFPFDLLEFFH